MNSIKKTVVLRPYAFMLWYGLIVGIVPVVYNTILASLDLLMEYYGDDPGGSMKLRTQIFILPLAIILAIYHYKIRKGGYLRYKEAWIMGLGIASISVAIMTLYHLFFNTFLAPSFHQMYYEQHGEQLFQELVDCCRYTPEQFEDHKNQRLRYDQGKGYLGDFLTVTLIGFIFGSISGLLMRKRVKSDL